MSCVLTDRRTGEPVKPEDCRTDWIIGEYDVTPSLDRTSAANWDFARKAAIAAALDGMLDRFTCDGDCDQRGHFCVLDVKVVRNRTGRIIRRLIDNDPESFPYKNGEKQSEHFYLTYEVQVEPECRCEHPPVRPAQPGGKVEHHGPPPPSLGPAQPAPPGYYEGYKLKSGYPLDFELKYKW